MDNFIVNTFEQFENNLYQIKIEYSGTNEIAEQSVICAKKYLTLLKVHISQNDFPSLADEIKFFKEIKPSIQSKLIYFAKVFFIETIHHESKPNILNKELLLIQEFHDENLEFFQYITKKMTHFDDKYFLRGNVDFFSFNQNCDFDLNFTTLFDFKIASFFANDLLYQYIRNQFYLLNQNEYSVLKNSPFLKNKFVWTDTKIALIELIYALQASGSINHGKTEIKDLVAICENIFNIDLGDFYHAYMEIKNRHHPAKYIEALRKGLLNRIQQQDSL